MKRKITRIFLIRGLARETRHWGTFLPKLAKSFASATIHPLEIPGTGQLRNMTSPTTITGYVKLMRQTYLAHTIPGDNCKIIGLSFGGMITAHWLKNHPDDFSAGILINTSFPISPIFKRMQIAGGTQLLLSLFCTDRYKREKRLVSLLCNLADHKKIAHEWTEISRTAPVSLMNILRQLYAAATCQAPEKIDLPTLILCSRLDRLVSVNSSEDIATLWHKKILCHEKAGHDLTTDDPDWCVSQLQSWHPFTSPLSVNAFFP